MSAFRWSPSAVPAVAALLLLAGCASQPGPSALSQDASPPGANASAVSPGTVSPDAAGDSAGVDPATGLASTLDGYWLVSATPEPTSVGPVDYRFQVLAPDGSAVTSFLGGDDTARVYAVRSDLTGLRRAVPTDLGEGVWGAQLGELDPGLWRIYVSFTPNSNPGPSERPPSLTLSRTLDVPGDAETSPLDPESPTASVDGLKVRLSGTAVAGRPAVFRVHVARPTLEGMPPMQRTVDVPVGSLESVDGAYAQMTAVRSGNLALAPFTALTPAAGGTGGPSVSFRGTFPSAGDWRVFVQFRSDGQDHTATFTVRVR
jgi:hypothetical protein